MSAKQGSNESNKARTSAERVKQGPKECRTSQTRAKRVLVLFSVVFRLLSAVCCQLYESLREKEREFTAEFHNVSE